MYSAKSDATGSYAVVLPELSLDQSKYTISAFHDVRQGYYAAKFKPIESFALIKDTTKNIKVAVVDSVGQEELTSSYNSYMVSALSYTMKPPHTNIRWNIDLANARATFPKIYINSSRKEFSEYVTKLIVEEFMPSFTFPEFASGITPTITVGTNPPAAGTNGYIIINETNTPADIKYTTTIDNTRGYITSASMDIWNWSIPNDLNHVHASFNKAFYAIMTNAGTAYLPIDKRIPSVINLYYNQYTAPKSYSNFDKMSLRLIYFAPPLWNFMQDRSAY